MKTIERTKELGQDARRTWGWLRFAPAFLGVATVAACGGAPDLPPPPPDPTIDAADLTGDAGSPTGADAETKADGPERADAEEKRDAADREDARAQADAAPANDGTSPADDAGDAGMEAASLGSDASDPSEASPLVDASGACFPACGPLYTCDPTANRGYPACVPTPCPAGQVCQGGGLGTAFGYCCDYPAKDGSVCLTTQPKCAAY